MIIDSHVNLHGEAFAGRLDGVLTRARDAGIAGFLAICDQWSSVNQVLDIANAHDDIWASIGAHPHYADSHSELCSRQLIGAANSRKVVAIGETGLDLYYNHSTLAAQQRLFSAHIEAAQASQLPLIVHSRNADHLMIDVLETAYARAPFAMVLHCYTSGIELAQCGLRLGAFISFSGILTFKTAEDVRQVALQVPLDRLLVETDCPYLAPVPYRGQICEPAFIGATLDRLAALHGIEPEAMARATTDNFFRLFTRAQKTPSQRPL